VDCCDTLRLAGRVALRWVCGARHFEDLAPGERRTCPCALAALALASRLPDSRIRFQQPRIRSRGREETSGFIHEFALDESHGLAEQYERRLAYDL
jgi:hypothetical protein